MLTSQKQRVIFHAVMESKTDPKTHDPYRRAAFLYVSLNSGISVIY